jgi:hypothetical protein
MPGSSGVRRETSCSRQGLREIQGNEDRKLHRLTEHQRARAFGPTHYLHQFTAGALRKAVLAPQTLPPERCPYARQGRWCGSYRV